MIILPVPETFALVVYFVINAFIARKILEEKQAKHLHKFAWGSQALGIVILLRFML